MLDLTPPTVDPAVIWGSPLTRLEEVEAVLREYCLDLVESECYDKLRLLAQGSTIKRMYAKDYERYLEEKAGVMAKIRRELGLPVDIEPSIAEQLYNLLKEAKIEEAKRVLGSYLRNVYGYEEEEIRAELEALQDRFKEAVKRLQPVDIADILEPIVIRPEDKHPSLRRWRKEFYRRAKQLQAYISTQPGFRILAGRGAITSITVKRTDEVKTFKELNIANTSVLLDFIKNSRLFQFLREKFGVKALVELDLNTHLRYASKDSLLVYDLDPIVCYALNDIPVVCNQLIIVLHRVDGGVWGYWIA
jgi:hypothetical protein